MVDIQLFLVNTFTRKVFHGQAVAVCVIKEELNDELLHAIAIENHLPETAFIQAIEKTWHIRWFNREGEMYTSGHGLLAAAYIIFHFIRQKAEYIEFVTTLGTTKVWRQQEKIYFDYPVITYDMTEISQYVIDHVEPRPEKAWQSGPDIVMQYPSASLVEQVVVDKNFYKKTMSGALILTSIAEDADFYVRCFFPSHENCEETATAAIYPRLAIYWAEKLQKQNLVVEQGQTRRSEIFCDIKGSRIHIGGYCCCFYQGELLF